MRRFQATRTEPRRLLHTPTTSLPRPGIVHAQADGVGPVSTARLWRARSNRTARLNHSRMFNDVAPDANEQTDYQTLMFSERATEQMPAELIQCAGSTSSFRSARCSEASFRPAQLSEPAYAY